LFLKKSLRNKIEPASAGSFSTLPLRSSSLLSRQQPLDRLPELPPDSQQHLGADLALTLFIPRQLPLADPKPPRKFLLIRIKAAQLPQAPSDGLPVNACFPRCGHK
jgi:hypothetical protein